MADRIGQTDTPGPAVDRRAVQRLERFGFGTRRVLGDVHDGKAVLHRVGYRLDGGLDDAVDGPVLGILPDRGRADEGRGLDLDAHLVRHPYDRLDVRDPGPGGAG